MPRLVKGPDGVIHSFPDDATDREISDALETPKAHERSWTDTAVDLLPAIGGTVGGIVGGIGGTVAGMGVGGVPGAVGGAALGGGAGEAAKQLMNRWRGQPAPDSSVDAAKGIAGQAAVQGGSELAGAGIGKAFSSLGPRIMQAAVKPTMAMLGDVVKGAPVPRVVKTLLDEGVNVTPSGFQKLQGVLNASKSERATMIDTAIQNGAPGVNPFRVTQRLGETAKTFGEQVNPAADLEAVSSAGQQFLDAHGGKLIPLDEANALKTGTYQQLKKKYGQLGSADIEAQKALARGLKEEIEPQVPGVDVVNRRIGDLAEASTAVGRRVAVAGNRDPAGLAWLAKNPEAFLAALMDRSPAVKSMIARGLYQSAGAAAKVSPALIRAAVVALTSGDAGEGPAPDSSAK